ncbi:Mor transcription activator family protein [Aquipseudomonas campi]
MDVAAIKDVLPASVVDMAQRIGMPAALTVVEKMGGIRWRVAEGATREGAAKRAALADIVGSDIEELLHREYAGEDISLPRCHAALLRWRNIEINRRFEQGIREGLTGHIIAAELAREYRLTDRWIWDIVNKHVDTPPQGDLFH